MLCLVPKQAFETIPGEACPELAAASATREPNVGHCCGWAPIPGKGPDARSGLWFVHADASRQDPVSQGFSDTESPILARTRNYGGLGQACLQPLLLVLPPQAHIKITFAFYISFLVLQVFFAGPEEDRLFGRVLLGRGPLAGAAYPLYFRVDLRPSVVPGAPRGARCTS